MTTRSLLINRLEGKDATENHPELMPLKSMEDSIQGYLSSQKQPAVAILGNGNYGKALAMRLSAVGIQVYVGSRDPSRRKFLPPHAKLVTYKEAVKDVDVAFACIPVKSYSEVITELQEDLIGKIVVDISNPESSEDPCGAHYLASLLPESYIVKALNTVSAWALESDAFGGSRETYVCGNDKDSRQTVSHLLREMGLTPVDSGQLSAADYIEKMSLKLFPEWRCAIWMTAVLTSFCIFYYYLRLFGAGKEGRRGVEKLALYHANRIICWIALWLFSLVYLPGCLAAFIQICRGTKYEPFPTWMDLWMRSRKQLGLIGLLCASLHACLSLITLAVEQVEHMSQYAVIPGTTAHVFVKLNWNGEPSLLFATIAIASFTVLGIASLPTVNARMSWREWDFIQSKVGYFGLVFATGHVLIYAYSVFDPGYAFKYWNWNMPPAVFLQPLLPCLVLFMKLILLVPCINSYLWRIRGGWERSRQKQGILV